MNVEKIQKELEKAKLREGFLSLSDENIVTLQAAALILNVCDKTVLKYVNSDQLQVMKVSSKKGSTAFNQKAQFTIGSLKSFIQDHQVFGVHNQAVIRGLMRSFQSPFDAQPFVVDQDQHLWDHAHFFDQPVLKDDQDIVFMTWSQALSMPWNRDDHRSMSTQVVRDAIAHELGRFDAILEKDALTESLASTQDQSHR